MCICVCARACVCGCMHGCTCMYSYPCVSMYICNLLIDVFGVYRSDDESILYMEVSKRSEDCQQTEMGKECMLTQANSP